MDRLIELLAQIDEASSFDNERLDALIEDIRVAIVELLTDDNGDSAIAAAHEAQEALNTLNTIATERAEDAARREAEVAEILAALEPEATEDESDDEAEGEEPAEAEAEPETEPEEAETPVAEAEPVEPEVEEVEVEAEQPVPVAASSTPAVPEPPAPAPTPATPRVTRLAPRAPELRKPRVRASKTPEHMVIRASTNVSGKGIFAGDNVSSPDRLGAVFGAAMEESQHYRGPQTPLTLASIGSTPTSIRDDWGDDRFLGRDERTNDEKIKKLWEPIRASGGQCAPAPVDYTQPVIGVDDRPVRDALARFAADRGGVVLIPPPRLTAMSGSYTKWTHANDITPSSPATKNVLTMTCPDAVTTYVDAHVTAMKVGNFRQLYWPEQVDAWVRLAAVYAARAAEENLLTLIGAGSTNVTHATGLGTARDFLATLDLAVAGFRGRNRVPDQPLRMIAPSWLLGNIRADLVRQAPGDSGSGIERLATADTEIASWLSKRNINVTWALDGETGQEFGAQTDGALDGWPTNVVVYLFIEGTWLHLDGGQLNLGIIRDSTLVGTNDFLMFGEFMESAAFHGTESLRITIDICPNGQTAGPDTSYDPCAGGS